MDLYRDILIAALSKQKVRISFDNLKTESPNEIVGMACYEAIQKIKKILDSESLSDFECVEEIVRVFEGIGSDGGSRHDFG